MNMVDDATGTTCSRLGEQETIWAAVGVLRSWIAKYGGPRALYTDWKNVYKREPTEKERLRGKAPTTQFGGMCERLEIRIIAARSPQAKGRVERNNGVHQDRLVKKLRRQGIASYEAANEYMEGEYLAEHNRRFAREAGRPENYHVRAPSAAKLREVFRLETQRWISNDWGVQYRGHFLQLKPQNKRYGPTQAKASVYEGEDGAVEVHYRGERMEYEDLVVRPREVQAEPREPAKHAKSKSAQEHPWRKGYEQRMKLQRLNRSRGSALVGVSASAAPSTRRTNPGAGLRSGGHPNDTRQIKRKRDISNEVRKGTFLKRFDRIWLRIWLRIWRSSRTTRGAYKDSCAGDELER